MQFQVYPRRSQDGRRGHSAKNANSVLETRKGTGGTGSYGNLATTMQSTAASGTDKNGSTLTLASGISTGTGSSSMNFNVYGAGTTGSSANLG